MINSTDNIVKYLGNQRLSLSVHFIDSCILDEYIEQLVCYILTRSEGRDEDNILYYL